MIRALPPDALVLETERLWLTPFTDADIDIATALLCDPAVMRYVSEPETPARVAARMSDTVRRGAGGRIGIWCVARKDTGQKIGDGVLMPLPIDAEEYDWSLLVPEAYPPGPVEVGYLLVPDAWHRGFATEICARLLRFAFEETALDRVVACTDPDNAASQRVLGKCGMRPIGDRLAYREMVPWFELTRPEWAARAAQAPHQLPSGSPG